MRIPDLSDIIGKPHTPDHDCWSVAVEVLRRMDLAIPATPELCMASKETLARDLGASEPHQTGDVVMMLLDGRRHLAVVTQPGKIVHVTQGKGTVIEPLLGYMRAGMVTKIVRLRAAEIAPFDPGDEA